MRTDFENIKNGDEIILYPAPDNPLHKEPVKAFCAGGYFYCEGTNATDGPDYYFGDVLRYNVGFVPIVGTVNDGDVNGEE